MQLPVLARHARTAVIAMVVMFAALFASHGTASAGACDALSGKELYNCLATKLDHVAAMSRSPEIQTALQKAASQLRVATNKRQALSAISQARSVVAGVMQRVRLAGQDSSGLARVTDILANAARLIQSKG
jgi:proline dehydrogenase